jgi:predicted kinase
MTGSEIELVILIGLQASGKSTFYRSRFAATHEQISKDLMPDKHKEQRQQQLIAEALQAGRSIVVDNTNPTREARKSVIELGQSHGATVIGYYFAPQLKQNLERNGTREGKARVPDIAIYATLKRLERPSYAEGFDQLFEVRLAGDQTFEVSAWEKGAADGED